MTNVSEYILEFVLYQMLYLGNLSLNISQSDSSLDIDIIHTFKPSCKEEFLRLWELSDESSRNAIKTTRNWRLFESYCFLTHYSVWYYVNCYRWWRICLSDYRMVQNDLCDGGVDCIIDVISITRNNLMRASKFVFSTKESGMVREVKHKALPNSIQRIRKRKIKILTIN